MSALQDQWINQAQQLRADIFRLENAVLKLSGSNATSGQIAQAEIKHLNAVKQYNDFLDTAKQDYAKATQYEARLHNDPNLSALERHQLEITRDALNA
ncbi:hypothetical protein, partial [Cupriavidus necator]|uniref:hypothetical protein n=1 Tax=Cupriavidus necator TaxID=106590 RepID=UPI0030F3B1E9